MNVTHTQITQKDTGLKTILEQPFSRMTLVGSSSDLTDYWIMYNARGTTPVHHERPGNPHEPSSIKSKINPKTPEPLPNSSHHQEISAYALLNRQVAQQRFNREWSQNQITILTAFTAKATSKLDVLGLDSNTLCVDRTQVGVFKEGD